MKMKQIIKKFSQNSKLKLVFAKDNMYGFRNRETKGKLILISQKQLIKIAENL